ncbi:MAG: class B sortase [Oscillospiraceae bacterium]|jgi:sortase B|nr:class B sortase [Oscillospiraceae bacterium]
MTLNYNTRPGEISAFKYGKRRSLLGRLVIALFPVKGDSVFECVRKLIFTVALACFLIFGGSAAFDLTNEFVHQTIMSDFTSKVIGNVDINSDVYKNVTNKVPEILPEYINAYHANNDFVGEIKIQNTKNGDYLINLPVYQTTDNEYYLTHAFDKSYSKGGAIFADYRNLIKSGNMSPNTVLYGHNMMSGGYFTKLSRYYTDNDELSFYKAHPLIEFNTIYEKSKYKVFAVGLFNTQEKHGKVYPYNDVLTFGSKDEFNNFILDMTDRSVLFTDVDVGYGDYILTLSTCFYPMGEAVDTRVVVFARKLRKNESEAIDLNKAVYNHKELRFDEQTRRYGTGWTGRVWDSDRYLLS